MRPMATRRKSALHRSIIDGEHRAGWPVLSETEARATHARIVPLRAGRDEVRDADPVETLVQVYERVLKG